MAGASVIATGVGTSSEAVNAIGSGNTIINYGLIEGQPSSAIFFESTDTTAGRNVVENFGVIEALPGGPNSQFTGQAIGSNGSVGIDFINEPNAIVKGNLDFQGGDDNVTLFPGSKITGDFDGGGGFNTLTLNGAAGTNDSFSGEVTNFQTLTKTGPGSWTLTGSIGDNGGSEPLTVLGKSVVQPEPVLQPVRENRWGVWVTGFGDFVSLDSTSLAQGYSFTTGGVMLGVDYRITDHFAIGVSGSYAHTWTALQPAGNIDVNTGLGGVYATYFDHGFYVNAAAYGGYNTYDTSRQGVFGGSPTGNTNGDEVSTFIGGGYDWHFGNFSIGPLAYFQYTDVHINGYNESGSDFPLQIHSDSEDSLRTDFGFRTSFAWPIGHIYVVPFLSCAWEHEFEYSALPITATLGGVPGATGTFSGPFEGHDSAVISAGVRVNWTPMISTYVSYDGQLGRPNYESNAVAGGISVSF